MISSITLCTSLLGLFLVVPLLATIRKRPANAWLAAFVFSMSVLAMADYALQTQFYMRHPMLLGLFDWPVAGLGGIYYLYVLGMSGQLRRRHLWHLAPMLLWAGWLAYLRLVVPVDRLLASLSSASEARFHPELLVFQLVVAAYVVATLRCLRRYHIALRDNYSNTARRDLNWLRWLTIVMGLQFLLWLPVGLMGPAWVPVFDISRLATLYLLGWFGMRQSAVFLADEIALQPTPANTPASAPEEPPSVAPEPGTKYARSGMTDEAKSLIGKRLIERMESERIYQDANLTLSDLAGKIGTSPQLLSQYLNEVLGMSFFEYINAARVRAVQALMLDSACQHHTVLELAFKAGFNSKSAFNTSFKRMSGMTPSQWKKQGTATAVPIG
jgi:AraC-like DNA-binding protein